VNETIVILGANWLGDSVMSLPAMRAFRAARPGCRLLLCVKPGMAAFWDLASCADGVVALEASPAGTWRTARRLRALGITRAALFPNSFRAALVPALAGIPERVGFSGHGRAWLLTRRVPPPSEAALRHQCWEYAALLGVDIPEPRTAGPLLHVSPPRAEACAARYGLPAGTRRIAFLPGAARGPSKRWPEAHFIALGRQLAAEGRQILVMGVRAEAGLCGAVAAGIGDGARSLAGETGLAECAAVLTLCHAVVANDSGGMHLAAALGVPTVALFGMTDPIRTGPLGAGHRVLCADGVRRGRDIPRNSRAARASLALLRPETVYDAVCAVERPIGRDNA
jgi:heptosyltransferase II